MLLILLAVGAVVLVGLYFWIKPYLTPKPVITPEPTSVSSADWLVYKNPTYGFGFKYPKEWKAQEKVGPNSDQAVVSLTSPETSQKTSSSTNVGPLSQYDFSVYYYDSVAEEIENKSNNWGATTLDELISKSKGVVKLTAVSKLGDANAIDVVWSGEGTYYTILATKNNHLYKIFFANRSAATELTLNEKEILRTFQFTTAETATVTVSDLVSKPEQYISKTFNIIGTLSMEGSLFGDVVGGGNAKFYLVDNDKKILIITSWAPTEAIQSPTPGTANPNVISNYVNKKISLTGQLQKANDAYQIIVPAENASSVKIIN